jgi:hypothetical protein
MRTEFERAAAANRDKIGNLVRQFQTGMKIFGSKKVVRVVVACEDAVSAARASLVLDRIEGNFEAKGRIIYSLWNYEDLAIAALKKVAAFDVAAADVIAFAVHDGSQLPEEVIDWISEWLAMGTLHSRALLAIVDSDTKKNGASRATLSQLRKVAELGEMGFLTVCLRPSPDALEKCAAGTADRINKMDYENNFGAKTNCRPSQGLCLR